MSFLIKALESIPADIFNAGKAAGTAVGNYEKARNESVQASLSSGKPLSPIALVSVTPDAGPLSLAVPAAITAGGLISTFIAESLSHPVYVNPIPNVRPYVGSKVTPIEPPTVAAQTLSQEQIALAKKPPTVGQTILGSIPKTAIKIGAGAAIVGGGIGVGLNYALYGSPVAPSSHGPSGGITALDSAVTGAGGGNTVSGSNLTGNTASTPSGGINGLISTLGNAISGAGNALTGAAGAGVQFLDYVLLAVVAGVGIYAAYILIGRAKK